MEAKAEAEAVAVVPEPARASSMLKQHKLPEPALPNPTRSTETCLAWHILIQQLASPRTPTATANGSMISSRTRSWIQARPETTDARQGWQRQKGTRSRWRQHGRR